MFSTLGDLGSKRVPLALGCVGLLAASIMPLPAAAQEGSSSAVITSEEAKAALPDAERYRLEIDNDGLDAKQRQDLGAMLIDTIGDAHFFGAIYAFLPEGSNQLSIHLRLQLHSLDAAERSALADCEAERSEDDSECYRIGRIIPEDWDEDDGSLLSHEATFAFSQNVDALEGSKIVARSRNTTAWAMWSGENVRQRALDECNEAVEAGGFEPDCEIIIDDGA